MVVAEATDYEDHVANDLAVIHKKSIVSSSYAMCSNAMITLKHFRGHSIDR